MHSWSLTTLAIMATSITTTLAAAVPVLEARAKAIGGPAGAKVTIYNSYTCVDPNTPPPTDGSAGTAISFNIAEGTCTIPNSGLLSGGALTATLTAAPKTGTAGCYVVGHTQQGCGLALNNQIHGWPFNGVGIGNSVGCGNAPSGTSFGAFEIICP